MIIIDIIRALVVVLPQRIRQPYQFGFVDAEFNLVKFDGAIHRQDD